MESAARGDDLHEEDEEYDEEEDEAEGRNCDCWHCVDRRSREAEERERSAGRSEGRRFNRAAQAHDGEDVGWRLVVEGLGRDGGRAGEGERVVIRLWTVAMRSIFPLTFISLLLISSQSPFRIVSTSTAR